METCILTYFRRILSELFCLHDWILMLEQTTQCVLFHTGQGKQNITLQILISFNTFTAAG